jgi:hypothetical protein
MDLSTDQRFKTKTERYLSDIRFWILLFFVLRLYGITEPPLEIGHSWRQSLTNMIARNLFEVDSNVLYPRIDMDGNHTGIIASEFPFFNYLIYIFAKLFAWAHWYGRLINLVFSSIGILYFYKLLDRFFSRDLAFAASMLLLSSIWFAFSRKSMPDTFCMSLALISIYHGVVYFYDRKISRLFLFCLFGSLAVLSKIPALYLFGVLAVPFWDKKVPVAVKRNAAVACAFILALTSAWYFVWVPHLLSEYGFQLYFPKKPMEGLRELMAYAPQTLEKFYFSALQSFAGFAVFLAGLFVMLRRRDKLSLALFLLATGSFVSFIMRTGFVFSVHNYYVIPYAPVMAFVAAQAIVSIPKKSLRIVLLAAIMLEGILNQQHDFFVKKSERYKEGMESMADRLSGRKDLFVINAGRNPQQMYFLHRKGWSAEPEQLERPGYIDSLAGEGARFLLINKNEHPAPAIDKFEGKEVFSDSNFVVFSLHHKQP